MRTLSLRTLMVLLGASGAAFAAAVLQPLAVEAARGPNLVTNPGFEEVVDGLPRGWSNQADPGWALEATAHSGAQAVRMAKGPDGPRFWISQNVTLNQERARPLVVSAWSRADGVEGSRGAEYSVWVDLQYADGTHLYGQRATFDVGTHDWALAEHPIVVRKPVRSATVHLLFRRGYQGTVWFDDVALHELQLDAGMVFDGTPAARLPVPSSPGEMAARIATGDGLAVGFDAQGRIRACSVGGRSILGTAPGGLWLRDVAAGGPWTQPDLAVSQDAAGVTLAGTDAALDIGLEARWTATADGLDVHATLRDLRGEDRAVTAYLVLPVEAVPWQWHEDLLHSTRVDGGEYCALSHWPLPGLSSAYPWCSITSANVGLSLAVPMDCPRVARLAYNDDLKALVFAVNLGLVRDTARFPSQADFRVSLYWHEPAWGFRAATAKYYQRHPQFFVRRLERGGVWNAFGPIHKMPDWQDFGFAYDENSETPLAFDNEHGITAFRYIEPMTTWLPMAKTYPRTAAGALQALQDNLARGTPAQQRQAQVTLLSGVYNRQQALDLSVQNQAWCDGAVFTLNPDPTLPVTPEHPVNKGLLGYSPEWAEKNLLQKAGPRLDGIYIDSMPNWGEVRNWRREHWRTAAVPLTFDPELKAPVLLQMFSTWQYVDWIARDVHARGGVMHGNGGTLWPYFPALLDVTGQETGAILPPETMAAARALLRHKPYSPLLNTRFADLPPTYSEDYFHACLLWGIFPSYFCGDVFEDGAWKITRFFSEPRLYEKVRPLYRQFIPILRRMHAAGWEPITLARTVTPGIRLERYGNATGGEVLLAVFNSAAEAQEAVIRVDLAGLPAGAAASAAALVAGGALDLAVVGGEATLRVAVAPSRCEVVRLAPPGQR